jgi:hypothetical protein
MKSDASTSTFPIEFGLAAGLALGISGQFPTAVLAAIAWFFLRKIRPQLASSLVLVASLYLAPLIISPVAIAMGLMVPSAIVEMIAVTLVALLLFLTAAPVWSYLLIAHSLGTILIRLLNFQGASLNDSQRRLLLGVIVLKAVIIWILIMNLRRQKSPPAGA